MEAGGAPDPPPVVYPTLNTPCQMILEENDELVVEVEL
jgi:hypothetical protein